MKSLLQAIGVLPFLLLAALTAGLALGPALASYQQLAAWAPPSSHPWHFPWLGVAMVLSYFVYGFALIFIAPLLNLLLGGRLKPYRGPQVSWGALPWYVHATLTLLPRLSFLEFICPTAYLNFYYRLMGMKIGDGVTINTTAIADPSLIELGEGVTLGGSCSIMGHYAQGGFLVLAPVKIGRKATIGLRAIVMGGVTIGEKAKVMAGSFVLPKTTIPAGETWGGIPARKVDLSATEGDQE
jgi:hypothetical protein